jgi:tricorn protease-like protein
MTPHGNEVRSAADDRLESWKEIAAYLKHSVRTVRRWEATEGLPVHRHHHEQRGSVYAFRSELDGWREGRRRRPAAPPRATRRTARITGPAAAVAVLAAAAGVWLWPENRDGSPKAPELVRLTTDAGLTWQPAISRDGKWVAYSSDRGGKGNLDIWIQRAAAVPPVALTAHPANDTEPSFSPDGETVVFRSERDGGGVYAIPIAPGGVERRIADQGRRPSFSPDGRMIAYWTGTNLPLDRRELWIAPAILS